MSRAQGLSWSWADREVPSWQPGSGETARTANSMTMMYQGAVNLCRNAESLGKTEMKEHCVFQSITVLKPCTSLAPSSYITLTTLASDILKLSASGWQKMTRVIAISSFMKQVNFGNITLVTFKTLTKTKPALKMTYPLFSRNYLPSWALLMSTREAVCRIPQITLLSPALTKKEPNCLLSDCTKRLAS